MKKLLLFIIAFVIGYSVSAQKAAILTPMNSKAEALKELNRIEPESTGNPAVWQDYLPRSFKGANAAVKKVIMGTSVNAFTLLTEEQTAMHYNKELNAIMGSFRGNPTAVGTLPFIGTGNKVVTYLSTDDGATFPGVIACEVTVGNCRYPSGVISNPAGNTNVLQAYSVVAGPATDGAGWINAYFGSQKLSGTSKNVVQQNTSAYQEIVRGGLSACADGTVHMATEKNTDNAPIGVIKNGVYNATNMAFDWTQVDLPMPFIQIDSDGTPAVFSGTANMAWNKSGSVGYLLFRGVDTVGVSGKKGFYPIVFKSIDKGVTWTKIPHFDFSKFPDVVKHIWPTITDAKVSIPFFDEVDLVVDSKDNLHIMANIKGTYTSNRDSLSWTFTYEKGKMFNFSLETGIWKCRFIAENNTLDVSSAKSPYASASGNQGWGMRMQASRTDDGKKVFAVWTDTDWEAWSQTDSINLNPDVLIWGLDVMTNKSTKVKNITDLQEGWGECHFMFASPVAMDKAGVYTVPVSISDIYTSNLNADAPVAHYFLQGVSLADADFTIVGTKPISKVEAFEVTSYPNPPVNGKTNIKVNLERSAPVSVIITSVTGQQVSRVSYGTMNAGSQILPIDAGNLKSGVYFYTVIIGNQRATNKMVIK